MNEYRDKGIITAKVHSGDGDDDNSHGDKN